MSAQDTEISIHMIEPADGRTLQKWTFPFPAVTCISIGRDDAASVQVADPYVSRIHLEIVHDSNGWNLLARGRNGVYVDGRSVTEYRITHGTRFRLSSVGPIFRFDTESESMGLQTLSIDPAVWNLMALNKSEVLQQADEITETDYFQRLQDKARQLRRNRGTT